MRISDWSSDVCSSDLYATALSIQAALKRLYRRASVVVCFSASNLAHVAKSLGGRVVADHDESGTGERAARETGLPWCMPPDVGTDANDMQQARGHKDVADIQRSALCHDKRNTHVPIDHSRPSTIPTHRTTT